ncbi:MAG: RES family NAD+ phosphorylase [Synechococcaceae cyanobacterium RM1_1_27]|nr:RES family NAD+ phosphorylase [Synechococcaceae cyanobacterium SM2_3_2]NJO85857.1 RES family NAD+ phosphorylase [Synechococcaceae cyanobacterium RM1_1_27]
MVSRVPPKDLAAHPDPPSDFQSRILPVVRSMRPFFRLNSIRHPSALYFDRSGEGRFYGAAQGYGILYVGEDEFVPFIESFGRVHSRQIVEEKILKQRYLAQFDSDRPLQLVDLTGSGLVKIRSDARLTSGSYEMAPRWAKAIFNHPQGVDGIKYLSRLDNTRACFGLFDRVSSHLQETNLGTLLDQHQTLLAKILNHYGYGLI